MKVVTFYKAVLLFFLACTLVAGEAHLATWRPNKDELALLSESVEHRRKSLFEEGRVRSGVEAVTIAEFILDSVAVEEQSDELRLAVDTLIQMQNRVHLTPNFGNVKWYFGDSGIVDRNAILFTQRYVTLALMLYGKSMPRPLAGKLRSFIEYGMAGIMDYEVPVDWTNVYLLKVANLVLISRALEDSSGEDLARELLAKFVDRLRVAGVAEFNSPTYYPINLDNLSLILNTSSDSSTLRYANIAHAYFWEEIAGNWYGPANRLGGPVSRDSRRLFGDRSIGHKVSLALHNYRVPSGVLHGSPFDAYSWHPPRPEIVEKLSNQKSRRIVGRYGPNAEDIYTHYVTEGFSLGSAYSSYGQQDNVLFVANFTNGTFSPRVSLFFDDRGDYYETRKTTHESAGHAKSLHLVPVSIAAQESGEVVVLATAYEGNSPGGNVEAVLLLPLDAEYWVGEKRIYDAREVRRWFPDPPANERSTRLNDREDNGVTILSIHDWDKKSGVGISRLVSVKPDSTYRLSASIKGEGVYLYLNFYDESGALLGTEHAAYRVGGKQAFVEGALEMVAPSTASTCKAWIYSTYSGTTNVEVKDIELHETDKGGRQKVIDSVSFVPTEFGTVHAPMGDALYMRRGDVGLAVRILGAWDGDGDIQTYSLVNDGSDFNARRMSVQYSRASVIKPISLAFHGYMQSGVNSDKAFAEFRATFSRSSLSAKLESQQLSVRGQGVNDTYGLRIDVGQHIAARDPVNRTAEGLDLLLINGEDVGKRVVRATASPE